MVTVTKTPQGHKIIDSPVEAVITSSGGDALVTFPYHGLGTGDYVYIESDIDEYAGFWYVQAINTNSFKIREYATADYVEFYQNADVTYYQTQPVDWVSAFLPIVYKAKNDRWPINSIDTTRSVSSTTDDNGYTDMTLSGNLRVSFAALEWVKISGAATPEVNGIWQIIEVISASRIVLDMPYDAGNSFSGASVQYYHNNYQVKVKIYAGLPGGHPWASKKPMTEIAELSLTPDDNGEVMFSIAEYVQGNIAIKNNPTLFSMPLNLDAFTGFYISTAESYDSADGYDIFTTQSVFTQNNFTGYAIAGKLPFKNKYSGVFADYVYTDGTQAKWLTFNDKLIAVEGKYFDISFIKSFPSDFDVVVSKYIADYKAAEDILPFTDQGHGVYRIPIEADGYFDSFCIQVRPGAGGSIITDLPARSIWETRSTDPDLVDWTTGSSPGVSISGGIMTSESSELLWAPYAFEPGKEYTITVTFSFFGTSVVTLRLTIRDDAFNQKFGINAIESGSGSHTIELTFIATSDCTRIALAATIGPQLSNTITFLSISGVERSADVGITEEICIDIIDSCEAQGGFTPSDIRLLEDGSYRLLE